jgi:hypothetical protein
MASHVTPKSKYIRDSHGVSKRDLAAYRSNPMRGRTRVEPDDERAQTLKTAAEYTNNDSDVDHGSSPPPVIRGRPTPRLALLPVIGRRPAINPIEYEPAPSVGSPSPEAFDPPAHPVQVQSPIRRKTAHAAKYLGRRKVARMRFCECCESMHPLPFFAAPGRPSTEQSTRLCYNCQLKAQAVPVSTDNECT